MPVGYLKVSVSPDDAALYVDGHYWGPASHYGSSRKYLMTPGTHQVALMDPRCETSTSTVTIESGKTAHLSENLARKPDPKPPYADLKVEFHGEKFAAVMLNGEYVGYIDQFNGAGQDLQVSPGTYQVRIDVAGGQSLLWQEVTLVAGKTTTVRWDF
ncbi:MAG TPA: PEGA domain-containing protein [Bryobacteraceae bacterium]|nr:PEGA domain-containing protein [Bryobacteraceae bacterium]